MANRSKSILMYHSIDKIGHNDSLNQSLFVDPKAFERQMRWFARLGYRCLSLCDLIPYIFGRKKGKVIGLTFDDGFRNIYRHALPVISELGFTATCFVVTGQIGGYNKWDSLKGVRYTECMTTREIQEWIAAGNEIGAHTVDHVHLTLLDPAWAYEQISNSRKYLEDLTGERVCSFCYPYGDVSSNVRGLVEKAGFEFATTTHRSRANATDDPLLLPRRNIRYRDGVIAALRKSIIG